MITPLVPFIVGLVVVDMERATAELVHGLGLEAAPVFTGPAGPWEVAVRYTRSDEPYLQVIEGTPGGPFTAEERSRLDHLDVWADDFAADCARLEALGFALELDSASGPRPWRLYRGPATRLRIELHPPSEEVAAARRAQHGMPEPGTGTPLAVEAGIVVDDLAAATAELEAGLRCAFGPVETHHVDGREVRVARTSTTPRLALWEWPAGPWGMGLAYLAMPQADGTQLERGGLAREADGAGGGGTWTTYTGRESGLRVLVPAP